MKLLFIILFLFVIDIYFYTGTISTITKFFNNPIIYKLVYWFLSIAVYVVIIYILITYTRTTPSTRCRASYPAGEFCSLFHAFF